MADKWPLANGNYSNAANWNGGTLPVDGDVIFADNRTVTVDVDINLPTSSFRTTQRSGGTAGGAFNITAGPRSITIASSLAGSTSVFTTSGSTAVTFSGCQFTGSATATAFGLSAGSSGLITFSGCTCTGGNFGPAAYGIYIGSACSITGTLNCVQTANSLGQAFTVGAGGCTVSITGSITHGNGQTTVALSGTCDLTVTSETTIGTTVQPGSRWLIYGSGSQVTITRNAPSTFVFPSSWSNTTFMTLAASSQLVTYSGDLEQQVASSSVICNISGGSTFRHFGTLFGPAEYVTANSLTAASGAKYVLDKISRNATSGLMPVLGAGWCLRSDSQIIGSTESSTVTLVPSGSVGDPPAQANVRAGTVYHFATMTGSLVVPIPAHVSIGVSTDNTVGTLVAGMTALELREALFHQDDAENKLRVSEAGAVELDSASVSAIRDGIPKVGETHRYTQVDSGATTTDVSIGEAT